MCCSDDSNLMIPKLAEARPEAVAASEAPAKPVEPPIKPAKQPSRPPGPAQPRPSEPAIARSAQPRPGEPSTGAGADVSGTAPPRSSEPAVTDDPPGRGSRVPVVPLALGAGALVLGGTAIGLHFWGNQAYDRAKASMVPSERDKLYHSPITAATPPRVSGWPPSRVPARRSISTSATAVPIEENPWAFYRWRHRNFAGLAVAGSW